MVVHWVYVMWLWYYWLYAELAIGCTLGVSVGLWSCESWCGGWQWVTVAGVLVQKFAGSRVGDDSGVCDGLFEFVLALQ